MGSQGDIFLGPLQDLGVGKILHEGGGLRLEGGGEKKKIKRGEGTYAGRELPFSPAHNDPCDWGGIKGEKERLHVYVRIGKFQEKVQRGVFLGEKKPNVFTRGGGGGERTGLSEGRKSASEGATRVFGDPCEIGSRGKGDSKHSNCLGKNQGRQRKGGGEGLRRRVPLLIRT